MRVLVCGGRSYTNKEKLFSELDAIHKQVPIKAIIHGCAKGADSLADLWAQHNKIKVVPFPAQWSEYGKSAGHIRNTEMIVFGKPDIVVAFPGGIGTADMVNQATTARIKVKNV